MGERKFLKNKADGTAEFEAEADGVGVYTRLGFKACFNRVVAFYDRKGN
ncbi:hypothetical protein [Eisenbergiella sp.]